MTYKGFIVEDELHQELHLRELLREIFPELEIIGSANTISLAEKKLAELRPDLIFMDVMLPPYNAFDLLLNLKEISFDIIFTTSFEEYAVKAFRLSAVDYLVKPLVKGDLVDSVAKFKRRYESKAAAIHLKTLIENIQSAKTDQVRIALPTLSGYLFLKVSDIVRCDSDNTYTTFHTINKQKIVVSRTLKECEQMLVEYRFFRVHNSHLINLDYMVEYVKGEGGMVKMIDGSQVDVSRRRKEEFMQAFKKTWSPNSLL